ncbi:MAG: Diacylglycerol kinase [Firmicutes bacterium]|nr:Diacylglycerol kinase [Bacillota bacterium]MDI6706737.1 diacylglycerol kinase [Bacillota bacterium]
MEVRKLIESFNYAISGVIYTLKTQRNMKIHFGVAILVLAVSLFMDFSRLELLLLFFTISLVLVTEMINTSIEAAIDMITDSYHPLAKAAKNVAAGAVLISALNAIIVAYLIFFDRLYPLTFRVLWRVRQSPAHVTFISLLLVILVVVVSKSLTGEGTPLRGGLPSGHSAVAFSVVTAVAFISQDMLVTTLTLLLGVLVVQSRIETKIHNTFETIIGAILGIIITVLIFQLM